MNLILAVSTPVLLGVAAVAIVLIIWFFWWQHDRAAVYDETIEEVHHHHYDDEEDDEYGEQSYDEAGPAIDLDAVRVGATLLIHNYPDPDRRTQFRAMQRNRYELGQGSETHAWYEFKLISGRDATWLEWEYDEGLVITQWADEEIALSTVGSNLDELRAMAQRQSGTLEHDGVRYHFVNSAQARFYENDGNEGVEFESWTFEADDGERLLSVMLWPGTGSAARARPGWYLSPDEIELA